MAKQRILVCPICGEAQQETSDCRKCETALDPDSLLLAEGRIGPWWIRDEENPFSPGMTYDHLVDLANRGKIERHTLLRGPTTRQLWKVARRVAGIAHILGRCHQCGAHVENKDRSCSECKAPFLAYRERNNLGLDSSELPTGEIDGMSSFLTDTSILNTSSTPLHIPPRDASQQPPAVDAAGSPQYRALQRVLEQKTRVNRLLAVSLAVCVAGLVVAFVLLLK